MVRLLAFLACAKATVDAEGRVTLQQLFDGLVLSPSGSTPRPRFPGPHRHRDQMFLVFYKIVVDMPCTVMLRVAKPSGEEISGDWRDSI
jgi:hypothetical protein